MLNPPFKKNIMFKAYKRYIILYINTYKYYHLPESLPKLKN